MVRKYPPDTWARLLDGPWNLGVFRVVSLSITGGVLGTLDVAEESLRGTAHGGIVCTSGEYSPDTLRCCWESHTREE